MGTTTIYKTSYYVRWDAKGDVLTQSKSIGNVYTPPANGGLDGSGVAGQVGFWLDNNTLVGDEGLTYDEITGTLGVSIIKARDAVDTDSDADSNGILSDGENLYLLSGGVIAEGQKAGNVIVKAANAFLNDITPYMDGKVCLIPGNSYSQYGNPTTGHINFGDSQSTYEFIYVECIGTHADIGQQWFAKGNGLIGFWTGGNIQFSSVALVLASPIMELGTGWEQDVDMLVTTSHYVNGYSLTIHAGDATSDISQPGLNLNGGDLYLYGGTPYGTGLRGNIYFGDGSNGYLPAKTDETNVVYYDTATGLLSYGAAGSGGSGVILSGSTNNTVCTVTGANAIQGEANLIFDGSDLTASAGDMYADDFIQNSDKRLKTNIESYKPEYLDIDYKQFEFKENPDHIHYGVIAQEILKVCPELVFERSDGMLAVASVDLLFREIAYLKEEIKQLKNGN